MKQKFERYLRYTSEIRKKNLSGFEIEKFRPNEFFKRYIFLKLICQKYFKISEKNIAKKSNLESNNENEAHEQYNEHNNQNNNGNGME